MHISLNVRLHKGKFRVWIEKHRTRVSELKKRPKAKEIKPDAIQEKLL